MRLLLSAPPPESHAWICSWELTYPCVVPSKLQLTVFIIFALLSGHSQVRGTYTSDICSHFLLWYLKTQHQKMLFHPLEKKALLSFVVQQSVLSEWQEDICCLCLNLSCSSEPFMRSPWCLLATLEWLFVCVPSLETEAEQKGNTKESRKLLHPHTGIQEASPPTHRNPGSFSTLPLSYHSFGVLAFTSLNYLLPIHPTSWSFKF